MLDFPLMKSRTTPVIIKHCMRAGFTLIELLAAIAVIAILGTILVLAAGAARDKVDAVSCASNLRQISSSWLLYLHENGRTFPPRASAGGENWYHLLMVYMYGQEKEQYREFLGCPSQRREMDLDDYARTYSINGSLHRQTNRRLEQFPYPSKTMMFTDGGIAASQPNAYNLSIWTNGWGPEFIHDGCANIAFLDGHVEALTNEEIPNKPAAGTEGYLLWNGDYRWESWWEDK